MAYAGLDFPEGEAWFAGRGETCAAEEFDGETVGLRVVGGQEGEECGFAGAVGAEKGEGLGVVIPLAINTMVPALRRTTYTLDNWHLGCK